VAVACGDNQASFAGSVSDYGRSVLVNIGTGGQTSVFVEQPLLSDQLDLRPFLQEGFLLVGAGLAGGRSYRILRDFMGDVGQSLFGVEPPADLYDRLTALARQTPPGSDGVTCDPTFAGTRRAPDRRAAWRGLSPANFQPGNLARSLLEGVAKQYHHLYEDMLELGVWPRERLIGAGNGLRENPLLPEIVAETFRLPMQSPVETEEAAVGAALTAAVALGEFPDIATAGRAFILYRGVC
jgi:sedoheptulokinase